ncbi:MAG: hypothetical protein LQ338_000788 [Usnochroma carphineum]|nr:MAG: hypothetical protein LQ338_000788 [Usnochroma carphineum]
MDSTSPHQHHSSTDSTPPMPKSESVMPPSVGHMMSPDDPDNPQNWPFWRKIYASTVATAFAFAVAFGVTSLTVGIQGVMKQFNVSMTVAVLGLSLNLLGIAFAPIITPHLSERVGRSPVYLVSLLLFALFILGAGYSKSFGALAVCRFFAGFCGGPCLVLIEGTFADVWSPHITVTYYSFLSLASYIGAGCAPLILGYVVSAESWRWTQYVTLMIALAAYLLGIGVPETYPREILRTRARRGGYKINLAKAESGVTLGEMAQTTLFTPLAMAVSEPVVTMITLYLSLNFAVLFQWFIAVPAVLNLVYGFTLHQAGLAFIAAIVGALASTLTSSLTESFTNRRNACTSVANMAPIEYRLVPAMFGSLGMVGSLFWIGFTAKPTINHSVPIIGTGVYVWSSMSILTALVSYIFDAYPAKGTLSALTLMASTRIIFAAWLPLVIIQMIMGLQGQWAYSVFGFIAIPMIGIPVVLFIFGPVLRARSRHSAHAMSNGRHVMDRHVDQEMQMGGMHYKSDESPGE